MNWREMKSMWMNFVIQDKAVSELQFKYKAMTVINSRALWIDSSFVRWHSLQIAYGRNSTFETELLFYVVLDWMAFFFNWQKNDVFDADTTRNCVNRTSARNACEKMWLKIWSNETASKFMLLDLWFDMKFHSNESRNETHLEHNTNDDNGDKYHGWNKTYLTCCWESNDIKQRL